MDEGAMKLYDYSKSSAAYRVRIALNLKGLDYKSEPVPLLENAQHSQQYRQLNPSGLVPCLIDNGQVLTQSLAIIEYLEQRNPSPPLLPAGMTARAQCRAIALDIACDIHPLNNLRVLRHLAGDLGIDEQQKNDWYLQWLVPGLEALEIKLAPSQHPFCCSDMPTLADICLIPQLFNARRYLVDLSRFPTLHAIESRCLALPAFETAHPDNNTGISNNNASGTST